MTIYNFTKTPVSPGQLHHEIELEIEDGVITSANFVGINFDGVDQVDIEFDGDISAGEQTSLGDIVTNHVFNAAFENYPSAGGVMYHANFGLQGVGGNRWFTNYGALANLSTNKVPFVVPWKSRLVLTTFSNLLENADVDIEVYTAPAGQDMSTLTKKLTWTLRSTRTARVAFRAQDVTLEEGDKLAVFCKAVGSPIENVPVNSSCILYMHVAQSVINSENVDNFGDEISLGQVTIL